MMRTVFFAIAIVLAAAGFASAQEKPAAKPREELRYDGKPFAYWEKFMRTELKAERRIDAVRALAAFGARGYAKEAAAAIVDMVKDYDNDEAAFLIDKSAPEKGTPDQRIVYEAHWALGKIGPDAAPGVLAHLDHLGPRRLADTLYGADAPCYPIGEGSVPLLVRAIQSKDHQVRDLAVRIFGNAITYAKQNAREPQFRTKFVEIVNNEKNDKAIIDGLTKSVEESGRVYDSSIAGDLLGELGSRAKSAIPALARLDLWEGGGKTAEEALKKIAATPAERLPGLVAEFNTGSGYQAAAAAKMAELGADARPALGDLLTAIKKPLPESNLYYSQDGIVAERMTIVAAYVRIAGNEVALPAVVDMIDKNQVPQIDKELVRLFVKHEKDSGRIVAVVSKSLGRTSIVKKTPPNDLPPFKVVWGVQRELSIEEELIVTLGKQGEKAASSVPVLLKVFERSNEPAKLTIVRTLGKIGPAAKDALPMLGKLLQTPDAELRSAAAEAIQAITKR